MQNVKPQELIDYEIALTKADKALNTRNVHGYTLEERVRVGEYVLSRALQDPEQRGKIPSIRKAISQAKADEDVLRQAFEDALDRYEYMAEKHDSNQYPLEAATQAVIARQRKELIEALQSRVADSDSGKLEEDHPMYLSSDSPSRTRLDNLLKRSHGDE